MINIEYNIMDNIIHTNLSFRYNFKEWCLDYGLNLFLQLGFMAILNVDEMFSIMYGYWNENVAGDQQ